MMEEKKTLLYGWSSHASLEEEEKRSSAAKKEVGRRSDPSPIPCLMVGGEEKECHPMLGRRMKEKKGAPTVRCERSTLPRIEAEKRKKKKKKGKLVSS